MTALAKELKTVYAVHQRAMRRKATLISGGLNASDAGQDRLFQRTMDQALDLQNELVSKLEHLLQAQRAKMRR